MDCALCHNSSGWELDRSIYSFQHDTTGFPLQGQHAVVDCKLCHGSLIFSQTSTDCKSCHQDIHSQTVGPDCARCHDSNNWLVEDIMQVHLENGFPLMGVHYLINCNECHQNAEQLRFEPMGNDCINCHQSDFLATTKPNHVEAGYSRECTECHTINSFEWTASGFNHDFFPLTGGHEINDCAQCHTGTTYSDISSECSNCHQNDFNAANNPNHIESGFSNNCAECHTTSPDWRPANFRQHDGSYFPIFSGAHNGEWDQCLDCHKDPENYSSFICIECHEHNQGDMDKEHRDVQGYSYNSTSCLACHPNGNSESVFDHSRTAFPLTGAHTTTECVECHSAGYAGTSTDCVDCHSADFQQAVNPDHQMLSFSNDCASCHNTQPGWKPALMPNHNEFFTLNGAHASIAMDCASCHTEDFGNTPNTCSGCHLDEYQATTNPQHESLGFSDDCASCHSENAWQPANFDHDGMYFPIYSGPHNGIWNDCVECHTTEGNFMVFSCIECHEHNQVKTDDEHDGISGYAFNSDACLGCHPTGSADGAFDHNTTNFPLTGAHTMVECLQCHADGYAGTSLFCADCHLTDYDQANNPNHQVLGLSNDCVTCHTTEPGWSPATFDVHNEYYVIEGAHTKIASDCASCHNGNDYTKTPNTCAGCHINEYNATSSPPHQTSGFSDECASCHSQNDWQPANFDHDGQYFPIYSGSHQGAWGECIECHTTEGNFMSFNCIECHEHNQVETDEEHQGISGYAYNSDACLGCHPTGSSEGAFDHNSTNFPLTGAHMTVECLSCHTNGYAGTPTFCVDCHSADYNQTTNPNHQALSLSSDCMTCHTTEPGWSPANFAVHNEYYVITGAHAAIASDCAACHTDDNYSNTPNTCAGCHIDDYNSTTDPNHQAEGYSSDCAVCHSQNAWEPANFDHNNTNFPLTGAHTTVDCNQCHTNGYAGTPTICKDCHQGDYNQAANPNHQSLGLSNECTTCHTTQPGWNPASFDVHNQYYIITGAHTAIASDCAACHSDGNYANTPNTCAGCHIDDYNSTTDPNHQGEGYSTDCAVCHSQNAWEPANFDHSNTNFPLTGAHTSVDCNQCHISGYGGTSTICKDCHQVDYNQAANPNHQTLGLSNECATCHTTQPGWSPASFDVHNQYYVVTGAHTAIASDCAACHTNGNYANTPNTCAGCHIGDYNKTNDPPHQSSGFSTDCESCHTQNGWKPASFDHDGQYFPIYSGKHRGEWDQCIDCHTNPGNFAVFSCIDCHEHSNKTSVDNHHDEVKNYQYNSNACYDCHPTGRAD